MENVFGLNATEVTKVLASGNANQVLIIDCRSFVAYNQGRIVESVNTHCPPPILKRRSGGFIALEHIVPCEEKRSQLLKGVFPNVLVYDDNTQELKNAPSDSNILSVIKSLLKQVDGLVVRFIVGGFNAVREECPVLCMMQEFQLIHCTREKLTGKSRRCAPQQNEPAEILPHLYLGDVCHSSQRSLLERLGITALLNVSSNCGNHFQTHYRYMNVQVNDTMDSDLLTWFPQMIEFIDNVAAENGKVLVHCRAGVSRSATVCIAYIMQKQGLSFDSAFEFVMSKRPVIDPNLNFIQQLQRFETSLKSKQQPPVSSTSTTFSFQPQSAPLPPRHQGPNVFSFSTENLHSVSNPDHQDMEVTSPKEESFSHRFDQEPKPSSQQPVLSTLPLPQKLNLSPSSISQTAASPNPIKCLGLPASRPGSLPLLQVSTHLPSRPRTKEHHHVSSLLPSPTRRVPYPIAPMIDMLQGPHEAEEAFAGNYGSVPKTPLPNRTFSFFGGDIVTCQALTIPLDMSPRQCRPTTPTALDGSSSPFLGSDHPFPTVSVTHSPISPMGVPLSPLPSFG
ncbi:unnamed protein product [Lymnaea stagnalis]|uniref:Protein-serine/threonine phosphatase n=1 Tax=Lymnaea stagnalis TaxID=6523 RepID=A0AAV2I140_LYMST